MSGKANSLKSIIYALSANLAIAVAKLVATVITNSGSWFRGTRRRGAHDASSVRGTLCRLQNH